MSWRDPRLAELKRIMSKFRGHQWYAIGEDGKELNATAEEIKKIQDRCSHYYEDVTLFTGKTKICRYCDKESTLKV